VHFTARSRCSDGFVIRPQRGIDNFGDPRFKRRRIAPTFFRNEPFGENVEGLSPRLTSVLRPADGVARLAFQSIGRRIDKARASEPDKTQMG